MFFPATYITKSVLDINLEALKNDGIKGLIFDLDNTIMKPDTCFIEENIANWLKDVQKDFKIAVVSNNSKKEYMAKVKEYLDFPVYEHAKKPSRKIALEALKDLGLLPQQIAVVGDRALTDILLGYRLKSTTILVDPLRKNEEPILYKILRALEKSCISKAIKEF